MRTEFALGPRAAYTGLLVESRDVDVIIPARNDDATVGQVIAALPPGLARTVIVVDNGSEDATARVAGDAGAVVVREPRPGLGAACLRGLAHLAALPRPPAIVAFLAADGSDDPAELPALLRPLHDNLFDLAIGSRVLGHAGLSAGQRAGNLVAISLIRVVYGHRYTDLGPFRAIRYPALIALGMRDDGQGWAVEMQVRALKLGLRIAEVPVSHRRPEPRLHLADSVRGAVGAGAKVLFQILRHSTAR
jgi:glycosyltransferase involved in cell wall biosynthesis